MKILLDVRPLETGNRYRGFGYYIFHLVKNLAQIDQKNQYILLAHSITNNLVSTLSKKKNFKFIFIAKPKIRPRFYWWNDLYLLPKIIRQIKPDIFHSMDFNAPSIRFCKTIVTVHDLIPFIFKGVYLKPIDKNIQARLKFFFAKKADRILTDSEYSKKDILRHFAISAHRVATIPLAVDDDFIPIAKPIQKKMKQKYSGGNDFLMYVGDMYGSEPRKRVDWLIEAFARLQKEEKWQNLKLLLVGQGGGKNNDYQKLSELAHALKVKNKVIFTGFLEYNEMRKLLGSAKIFVYPSLYEGFGLPPLQALACGAPVVCFDTTSLPEVVDKTGLMVAEDPENLLQGIKKILNNHELRDELIKLGLKQAKKFSWGRAARETLKLYEKFNN